MLIKCNNIAELENYVPVVSSRKSGYTLCSNCCVFPLFALKNKYFEHITVSIRHVS